MMDAKTNLKARSPSRHVMASAARAPHRSAEIFKKTPYGADLKPAGRYVAKDISEVSGIPLLMKTRPDNGYLHGECMTVTDRTIAENLKSVTCNPNQDVVRGKAEKVSYAGA